MAPSYSPPKGGASKVLFLDESLVYERDRYYNLAGPRLLAAAIRAGRATPTSEVRRTHELSDADVMRMIETVAPDLIGLSAYVWNMDRFLGLVPKIKAAFPETFIIMGGPSASALVRGLYQGGEQIDLVACGEGEDILVDLLAGRPGNELPGVYWYGGGRWHCGRPLEVVQQLDALPSPYEMGLIHETEVDPVLFEFSRGCPYRCSYCSWPSNNSRLVRSFGAHRMLQEVRWAVARQVRQAWIVDAAINYAEDIFDDILNAFEHGDPRQTLGVFAFLKFEFVQPHQIERMARVMNTRDIHMPIESTSPETLRYAHRPFDAKRFERALGILKANGITPSVELLLGLPHDTYDGFCSSVEYALSKEININVFNVVAYPGSEVFDKRAEFGMELSGGPIPFVLGTPTFPRHDMERARDFVRARSRALEGQDASYTLRMEACEALHLVTAGSGPHHASEAFQL